jgi:ATP-dependent Lhr-like helicase
MTALSNRFETWLSSKNWRLHPHQLAMVDASSEAAQLLIAPTGAGKTLAGFLPSLIELENMHGNGLHTLYISPLKALAADIKRNLTAPVQELGLNVTIEDRTGDTSSHIKRRQRAAPPDILLTTPESLALLISYEDAPRIFANLQRVIVDEIHALSESKRGDQLMLALSRVQALAPKLRRIGLSATVDDPDAIARFMALDHQTCPIHFADAGAAPDIRMLHPLEHLPWAGAGGRYAIAQVLQEVRKHKITLIFHNTRAQAEIFFHALWLQNDDALPIAIHHGSLDRQQRHKVEQAIVNGQLRAVVCTGSLDLGIDWGDVDLVIQIGAPKNVKRLVQRIGRANHQYNAPSKAIIVPANRFETVECVAALEAVRENDLDGDPKGQGPLDVLCQHILLVACSGPFDPDRLYNEVRATGPYLGLSRKDFDDCLGFCTNGGYALRKYDRWQRLLYRADGTYVLRDPRSAQRIRLNVGTIQDTDTLKVRLQRQRGGKPLGEIEEGFAATLTPGDTFLIGGEVVRFESLREMTVEVSRQADKQPKIATFMGTKFATSTLLCDRILNRFEKKAWQGLPLDTIDWLELQDRISTLPKPGSLLVETFPRQGRHHLCVYGFIGRNAQQTLGLLISKQLELRGLAPLGFVATDYATLIWGLEEVMDPKSLFSLTDLESGLEEWFAENALMKRSFRTVATISGLIERNMPGQRKSGRQATFSSDIIYDTLRKFEPDHLMMRITRDEAMSGLVDFSRIRQMLLQIGDRIEHRRLGRLSPLSAPLFLEAGRVPVEGQALERMVAEEAALLMREAGLEI